MSPWARRGAFAGAAVAVAVALVAVGALGGSPSTGPEQGAGAPSALATAAPRDAVSRAIDSLQAQLKGGARNPTGWAELGLAYVQQARLTADPSYYPKAEGALSTSLHQQPKGNAEALTGQATLASARHDFPRALTLARASLAINAYSATTYGVEADALTELGRYDDAAAAVQKMLDLQPGTPSFSRASYQRELRGDVAGARAALERAAGATNDPADKAFAQYYLGELAWNNGDAATARTDYAAALDADQAYLPALVGRAKTTAAAGDTTAALALYREAVQTQPQPAYVIELGELLEATGQRAAAQEQYAVVRATQQLFAAAGANVDLELALFEADHGSPVAALRYATAAYRTRPDSILVEDAYAWALHVSGRDREALSVARRSLRLGTHLPVLSYHLGVILGALGDRAAARTSLQQALTLNPTFNPIQAPRARALLKELG